MCVEELKKYTEKLPSLDEFVIGKQQNVISYNVGTGQCLGLGLWKTNKVAVQLSTMSKGTIFPEHQHDPPVVLEFLHIFTGSVKVTYVDGSEKIVNTHESVEFRDREPHKIEALENVELIGITMPADESYPDGK